MVTAFNFSKIWKMKLKEQKSLISTISGKR